ncbi:putative pre-mRNA polyadenylation factor Fip1 domain-containing protein [Septoria linicola]|nr:putative pre-mRNA polyadenylation factor Fip1 domain-containing protein [Septoria linicola]
MEDDEDDFYGGGGGDDGVKQEDQMDSQAEAQDEMDVSEEGEDDDDDDDSDDDVEFTLERPDGAKAEPPPGSKAAKAQKKETASKAVKIEADKRSSTPSKKDKEKDEVPRAGSAAPSAAAVKGTLTHNGKQGRDFPETRTSQLDVNQIPNWVNGKPITAVDIDADLAEHSKPWRLPGTDQTDYFNYGFDEYTWTQYSLRQQEMSGTIDQLKQNDAQMKAMLGLGGQQQGGGMPQMPPMPPEMMGMDPQVMAQQMGIPVEMVQQFMQSGGMPPGMGGPQGQQGFGQQGGFGNDGASPQPQAGQGFQPPQGPGGGNMSMEGLSAQQMAIFQQEQQQQMGGGHRGGRNRRGRW